MTSYKQADPVYMKLCDEFPKVDPCILKAVAIENRHDYDAAFLVMVDEVLPYIPEITNSSYFNMEDLSSKPIARTEAAEPKVVQDADATLSCDGLLVPKHDGISEFSAQNCLQEVSNVSNTDELISLHKGLAIHLNVAPKNVSHVTSVHEDLEWKFMSTSLHGENSHSSFMAEQMAPLTGPIGFPAFAMRVLEEPDENLVFGDSIGSVEAIDSASEPRDVPCMAVPVDKQEDLIGVSDAGLHQDNFEMHWLDVKNKIPGDGIVSLPSQTKKIQLLDLSIQEAKTIKKALCSSLEAVRNTMRKVEEREKAVEKAKEVDSEGGRENTSRTEELKAMIHKAEQDNDVLGGEVYGERSILATEAMELQARLANMTEERDKALCILDEMRQTLELRLSAANEKIRRAEEEKLNKNISAKMYFNEQEAAMVKILQQAKVLQLEADENSKLREFLVDHGRAVDTLQGEISVICQDVKSLKYKFDKRVPLSESVSSSQTPCILASSTSSKRSIASQVPSDHEVLSELSSPAKQPTECDADSWEFVV